jgi:CDP-paratose 2-epimerase
MTILITGAAGFVGSKMAAYFRAADKHAVLIGIDNLSRKGSEHNIEKLKALGCTFYKGDISVQHDIDALPKVDWVIDCAANPSVLAGLNGDTMRLVNDNLIGTICLLEKCKRDNAGFIMLSTSRVYSIAALNDVPLQTNKESYSIASAKKFPIGFSEKGVAEDFSTVSPISLYGATKLTSEVLAMEYHHTFGFPVWINRCGVIAGAGQFGKIDQGIFSFWIYQYLLQKPLSFIGFGGIGLQARDLFHPKDVFAMVQQQMNQPIEISPRIMNLGGGVENTYSLAQLDAFCKMNIDKNKIINTIAENRSFDIPLYVTDYSLAEKIWNWKPTISGEEILFEILAYANDNIEHIKSIS